MTDFLTDPEAIKAWLDTHSVRNYTILPNGHVNVDGSVDLSFYSLSKQFTSILIKFNCVSFSFDK